VTSRRRLRLDRRFYGVLAAVYRAVLLPAAPPGPAVPGAVRRVLVVRHDRLGDFVVTTPLLAFLREALPDADVDLLASPGNAALAEADPRLARVIVRGGGWRGWLRARRECRARRYDLVLSVIEGRGLREGIVAATFAAPAAHRVTTPRPKRYLGLFSYCARPAARRTHMADRVLAVGRAALGVPPLPDGGALACYPYALGRRPEGEARAAAFVAGLGPGAFVVANAWAAEPHRRLDGARLAELLVMIAARHPGLRFVLTPPPSDLVEAEEAARRAAAAGAPTAVYPPSPHVLDVVALLRRAAAIVTPDTGLVHLAAAAGCPVVGLYSARSSLRERWAPVGVPNRLLVAPGASPITAIPLADAADAFDALWSEAGAGGRAG
jgi:ADP-heptose:LPS heptosyltransferase